jgi:hypothetical protein
MRNFALQQQDTTAINTQQMGTLHVQVQPVETQQIRQSQARHQTSGVFAAMSARNSGVANSLMEVNSAPIRAQEAAARQEAKVS